MRIFLYFIFFTLLLGEIIAGIVYLYAGAFSKSMFIGGLVAMGVIIAIQRTLGLFFPSERDAFDMLFKKTHHSNILVFTSVIIGVMLVIAIATLIVIR